MNRFLALVIAVCISSVCAATGTLAQDRTDEAAPPDAAAVQKQLQGKWKPLSAHFGGNAFPEELMDNMRLSIDELKYTVTAADSNDKGKLEIDVLKKPWRMLIVGEEGPNAETKIPAIFKFDKEKLVICYDLEGEKHPEAFESPANSLVLLIVYQRANENDK